MRIFGLLLLVSISCVAQNSAQTPPNNAELKQIFIADQRDRGNDPYDPKVVIHIDPGVDLSKNDAGRRARVRQLIDSGLLHTGADYFRAALVFQHGQQPEDYLLAHVLAEVSAANGENLSRWLAAATLDRYLLSIGKPQIFGTQSNDKGKPTNYDGHLLNGSLRAAECVTAKGGQSNSDADPVWCQ